MVDVCLILEGTYPYVTGGVSTWVHTLLNGLSSIDFALIHLTATKHQLQQSRYLPPANLTQIIEWPIDIEPDGRFANLKRPIPQAKIYHSLSTGFAGMLGCQIKESTYQPLIITEHGIYWREVEAGANELECGFQLVSMGQDGFNLQPLRHHWTTTFQDMARQAYRHADAITTVCRANAQLQINLDAPVDKCQVIPNSVNVTQLAPSTPRQPASDGRYHIGFVGRVVSIKDVLTFINACRIVAAELPQAQFYIIGPLDHDPDYVAQCRRAVAELGLNQRVTFTGEVNTTNWYHRLDVVVLTSLSEGQPLVLLEAMAAGTPIVATNVGGCAALILGATDQDRALGTSGALTPVGNPQATASAILKLCHSTERWQQASQAGQIRTQQMYSTEALCQAYEKLYNQWL